MAASASASASSAPTIPSLKQAFVVAQTNLLSQPLAPSRSWHAANDASEQPLPGRLVDDALLSLNQTVLQHCRRVYAPQANRNIAEQISNSYTKEAERIVGDAEDADGGIGRELDLGLWKCQKDTSDFTNKSKTNQEYHSTVNENAIDTLPQAWTSDRDTTTYPMEAKRYADTVQQLTTLNEQRKQLRQRVERLRRLQTTIEPLKTTDGGHGIQENLLTRNGPVEKELEKMRFLLLRVAGRVDELPKATTTTTDGGGQAATGEIDLRTLTDARKRNIEEFLADTRVFPS